MAYNNKGSEYWQAGESSSGISWLDDRIAEEIKKAYREMAKKHHPDKVASLGEDVKKAATEKFQKINAAYEEVKKQRSIN